MILRKRAEEILDLVKRTESEISMSDDIIVGDVYIGTGETDGVRLIAKGAKALQPRYPGIHYHISSGNAAYVFEYLDKGLIDFGVVFGNVDLTKYNALETSYSEIWGVLMRKDSPLAKKESISPKDLQDKPLILSQQDHQYKRKQQPVLPSPGTKAGKQNEYHLEEVPAFLKTCGKIPGSVPGTAGNIKVGDMSDFSAYHPLFMTMELSH